MFGVTGRADGSEGASEEVTVELFGVRGRDGRVEEL